MNKMRDQIQSWGNRDKYASGKITVFNQKQFEEELGQNY